MCKNCLRACLAAITLALLSIVAGCGLGEEKTYPVTGKVVWDDGQPAMELASTTVFFQNVDAAARTVNIMGEVGSDGTFRLRTGKDREGAPAGEYRVILMPKLNPMSSDVMPKVMDKRFTDYETSGLQVSVKPELNEIILKVRRYQH